MKLVVLLFSLLLSISAQAAIDAYKFDDPKKEKIYNELTDELRCLVCQNQNIAGSNAELAVDMRRKTYEMVSAGQSKQQVADYMADRYGDFVLYKPPFKASTAVLWIGPFIILAVSIWLMLRVIRNRREEHETASVSGEQLAEAARLLNKEDKS
ncbi:MAG: cytochrome c-type biogenesis protein [Sedimenticolaceae bacterium]